MVSERQCAQTHLGGTSHEYVCVCAQSLHLSHLKKSILSNSHLGKRREGMGSCTAPCWVRSGGKFVFEQRGVAVDSVELASLDTWPKDSASCRGDAGRGWRNEAGGEADDHDAGWRC